MKSIEIPLDVAVSSRRPWGEWADGRWRRVNGLGGDARRLARFRDSLHQWAYRTGGYSARLTVIDGADVMFRIWSQTEDDSQTERYAILAFNRMDDGGWLQVDGGVMGFGSKHDAVYFDRDGTEVILAMAETAWAGKHSPAAVAFPESELYKDVPAATVRALAITEDGGPVVETTVSRDVTKEGL